MGAQIRVGGRPGRRGSSCRAHCRGTRQCRRHVDEPPHLDQRDRPSERPDDRIRRDCRRFSDRQVAVAPAGHGVSPSPDCCSGPGWQVRVPDASGRRLLSRRSCLARGRFLGRCRAQPIDPERHARDAVGGPGDVAGCTGRGDQVRAVASSVVSFALALTLQAQQARDQNRIVLSGTASLSGLVTEADGKTPVRRAHVTSSRAGVNDSRRVSTDERGRYVFDALPSGLYIVSVTKGAYLRTAAGAIRPGYAGQQIVVRDGEAAVAPAVALWRGGVLAGRIVNAVGGPVRGAQVFAAPVRVDGGTRGLKRVSDFESMFSGVTNDHGDYRIYGLPPDSYVISAYTPPQMLADTSATELTWFVKPSPGTPPPAPRTFQYAPTLHPSVTDWQRATLVTLKQGEERLDL